MRTRVVVAAMRLPASGPRAIEARMASGPGAAFELPRIDPMNREPRLDGKTPPARSNPMHPENRRRRTSDAAGDSRLPPARGGPRHRGPRHASVRFTSQPPQGAPRPPPSHARPVTPRRQNASYPQQRLSTREPPAAHLRGARRQPPPAQRRADQTTPDARTRRSTSRPQPPQGAHRPPRPVTPRRQNASCSQQRHTPRELPAAHLRGARRQPPPAGACQTTSRARRESSRLPTCIRTQQRHATRETAPARAIQRSTKGPRCHPWPVSGLHRRRPGAAPWPLFLRLIALWQQPLPSHK